MVKIYWSTVGEVVLNAVFFRLTYEDGQKEGIVGKYPLNLKSGEELMLMGTRDVCLTNLDIFWHATDYYGDYFDCATNYELNSKCPKQIVIPGLGDRFIPDWLGCPSWDVDAPMTGRATSAIVTEIAEDSACSLAPCVWNDIEFHAGAILKAESVPATFFALPSGKFLRI